MEVFLNPDSHLCMLSYENLYPILGTILASYLLRLCIRRWNRLPLPPGPKGYPIVGNAYEIPHHYAWLTYADWAKEYEDVFSFNVFGKTNIVLNSLESITELLEKRSFNYSDRPRMVMASELMGWGWDFAHMPYTDRWRRHRRAFHQYFQPRNLDSYYPIQRKVTIDLLEQLGRSPEQFTAHIRQHVSSIVLRAAYGYNVQAENDFLVNLVHVSIQPMLLVVHATGTYLVEFLHFLKHVPEERQNLVSGRKRYSRNSVSHRQARNARGCGATSFVSDNLEKIKAENISNPEEEEEIIKNCAAIIYLAGSDTTASLLLAWILAMVHFPEVQKKAQLELEKAIGNSRLPEFSDRPSIPYIEAILFEVMRWHAITPLVPHRAMQEDEYNGYRIPAGATVTPNAWAILHNEELYPEPSKFKPERFLDEKQEAVSFDLQPDPTIIGSFGYGRRTCPGRHLASNTAWIAISNILATYNISKAVDNNGNIIEPKIEFSDGLVSHPKPYDVKITPRSEHVFKLIDSAKMEILQ